MPSMAPRCEGGDISPINVEPNVKMTLPMEKLSAIRNTFNALISRWDMNTNATPPVTTHSDPNIPRDTRLGSPRRVSACDNQASAGASTICIKDGRAMIHAASAARMCSPFIK
jgi:hypothetical protein